MAHGPPREDDASLPFSSLWFFFFFGFASLSLFVVGVGVVVGVVFEIVFEVVVEVVVNGGEIDHVDDGYSRLLLIPQQRVLSLPEVRRESDHGDGYSRLLLIL